MLVAVDFDPGLVQMGLQGKMAGLGREGPGRQQVVAVVVMMMNLSPGVELS